MLKPSAAFYLQKEVRLSALLRIAKYAPHPANGVRSLVGLRSDLLDASFRRALRKVANSERLNCGANHMSRQSFDWFWPTEPQMVFAIGNQLNHPRRTIRLERVNAFLAALAKASLINQPNGRALPSLKLDKVTDLQAEKVTEAGKRIDLWIAGEAANKSVEALVEVKLGHSITPGQLQSYTKDDRGCTADGVLLVVSAPFLTKNDSDRIREANLARPSDSHWAFIDLRHLLVEYACALPREFDDEEFGRVRRSIQELIESWY